MTRSVVVRAVPFVLSVVVLVGAAAPARATDAGAPKAVAPAGAPGVPAATPAASGLDWEHMTVPEKKKVMKTKVLPEAKKIFAEFDPKAYKKVTCATCHGDGVDDGKYKMPNPKLPKLPKPTARADFVELQKKKPDAVKFMSTVVKPTMARLLNISEWAPDNTKGFGCYHCHTKEGE